MRRPVQLLSDQLVDQIAAGEVVERPASVVKELLENAVDAGARQIVVETAGGGVELVRVTDDGHAMGPEDAVRSVQRHATSKIASLEDLAGITTLGFRGEALPSIASVSKFVLKTRRREDEVATQVRIEGTQAAHVREVGAPPGTSVEVRDLFFNVPARRKFLKSQGTEHGHVTEACVRVALGHPELQLRVVRDGRRVREFLSASRFEERAAQALSDNPLAQIQGERNGVRVQAMLGAPEKARAGSSGLYTYVNGRFVRERALSRAVAFAYGSVLSPGRFPTGVVSLWVPAEEVDVNVHPQKLEVRFARAREVLGELTYLLARSLSAAVWSGPASRGESYWQGRLGGLAGVGAPNVAREQVARGYVPASHEDEDPWHLRGALSSLAHASERERSDAQPASPDAGVSAQESNGVPQEPNGVTQEPNGGANGFGSLRALGQVGRRFIVCEGQDGVYFVDQHAADERLRFNQLREQYARKELAVQRLLFPQRADCSDTDLETIETHQDDLTRLGLECDRVGPQTVAIRSVPALVGRACPAQLLRDVLDETFHGEGRGFSDRIDHLLATMACHGAIRTGDPLSLEQCAALLRAVDVAGTFSGHCPHGRPIVHRLGFGQLDRAVGR